MNHYKDADPLATVNGIRTRLADLNLMPVEFWTRAAEGIFSLRLTIPGYDPAVGTNGKGVNEGLALASAYGEFMERLENQLMFHPYFHYQFDDRLADYCGFFFSPGETRVEGVTLRELVPDQAACLLGEEDWERGETDGFFSFLKTRGAYVCLPYQDLRSGETVSLPFLFMLHCFGSNGMCSGNTREEALVQGMSEILERHVMKTVLREDLIPPQIPRRIIAELFPEQNRMMDAVEAQGDFTVTARYCGLGKDFPVIASVFIDRERRGYSVNFGAHPDLSIALERTLTELFQNKSVRGMRGLLPFEADGEGIPYSSDRNINLAMVSGAGRFPARFFTDIPTGEGDIERLSHRFRGNVECLDYLKGLLLSFGRPVYVRDAGFHGFPAYHVMIPGVSEAKGFGADDMRYAAERAVLQRRLRTVASLSANEAGEAASVIEKETDTGNFTSFRELARLPFLPNSALGKMDASLLAAVLRYRAGEIEAAVKHLSRFIDRMPENDYSRLTLYVRCARDLIVLRDGKGDKGEKQLLETFYPASIVEQAERDFTDPGAVPAEIGDLPCPVCDACRYGGECGYPVFKRVHRRFKEVLRAAAESRYAAEGTKRGVERSTASVSGPHGAL